MSTRRELLTQAAVIGLATSAAGKLNPAIARVRDPMTSLKSYRIPHSDLVVSRLAFGCAMLGVDWNSADFIPRTMPMINAALGQGITFFDLADVYGAGKAETALGLALAQSPGLRQSIVIQTKCGDRFKEGGIVDNSRQHILGSVEGSLKRLSTDYVDILLLHWPDSLVQPDEVARAFDELKQSGKVRYFGVSNHNRDQIALLRKYVRQPLITNQIQLGLAHWFTDAKGFKGTLTHGDEGVAMVDYCRANDILIQAYSPLGGAGIGRAADILNPPADARKEITKAARIVAVMAEAHAVSPYALALAWLLRHPAGIVPILGGTKPEHLVDNCAADRVELSREEWYSLLNAAGQSGTI